MGKWDLLNIARVKGIKFPDEQRVRDWHGIPVVSQDGAVTARINCGVNQVQPVSITTAVGLMPSLPDAGDDLIGSGTRPPFDSGWYEWQSFMEEPGGFGNAFAEIRAGGGLIREHVAAFVWRSLENEFLGLIFQHPSPKKVSRKPLEPIGVFRFNESLFDPNEDDDRIIFDYALVENESIKNISSFIEAIHNKEVAVPAGDYSERDILDTGRKVILEQITELFWSWLMMNCKNVVLVETHPSTRGRKARRDPERIVYRDLKIEKSNIRSSENQRTPDGSGLAFHVRRGHFADYTKGKGLFGKYKGRYWMGPTTVGDPQYGTVLKSYTIVN